MVLTYILPIGSMTFTYARIGLELWGSQSIGENTAGQLEGIRSKRRVSSCCWTRTDRKVSLVINNRRNDELFFFFFHLDQLIFTQFFHALDEDDEKSSKRDSIRFLKIHRIISIVTRVNFCTKGIKRSTKGRRRKKKQRKIHSNPVEVFARPLFSTIRALTRYRATKLAFIYSPTGTVVSLLIPRFVIKPRYDFMHLFTTYFSLVIATRGCTKRYNKIRSG